MKDILLVTQIVIQLSCAVYAYKCYSHALANGNRKFWNFLTLAFFLMALRRVTSMMKSYDFGGHLVENLDGLGIPFIISVFLLIGMKHAYNYMLFMEAKNKEKNSIIKELRMRSE